MPGRSCCDGKTGIARTHALLLLRAATVQGGTARRLHPPRAPARPAPRRHPRGRLRAPLRIAAVRLVDVAEHLADRAPRDRHPRVVRARDGGTLEPRVDARRDLRVALGVARAAQLVVADPAQLGDERALGRVAAEQRGDPHRVRRELLELRVELPFAPVAPEIPPLVRAPRPHRLWFTASTLFPSGSRTKAPT